ncbi:extracellular solute-binding protein [Streptosporangium subroseum]|uniref:ABC transporter substrate-binding protein n=1 Tax=Streptosporangium subroseum TaxID=106412 RepID=UPI003417A182
MSGSIRWSRLAAVAAAALTLTITAACGDSGGVGGDKAADQKSAKAGETVTLNYWTWFPAEATLKTAIAGFEAENPNIKIQLRSFEAADYQKQLPLALNGAEKLDVVGVQIDAMTNSVREKLHPVADWESHLPAGWRDKLNKTMVDQAAAAAKDGKLYDIPMGSIGSAVMYTNNKILSELGLSTPKTVADLKTVVDKVKANKKGVTPVVFSGEGYWQEEMLFSFAGQTDPTLSVDLQSGKRAWNDPAVVKALTTYKSLFDQGLFDKSVLSLKGTRPNELFASGKAAIYFDGSWSSSMLSDSARKAGKIPLTDVGGGAIPVVDPAGKPAARAFAEGGLGIPLSSEHMAEAGKFIQYMTLGNGVTSWSKDLVLVPSLNGFQLDSSVLTTDAAKQGYADITAVVGAAGSGRNSNQAFLNQVEGNVILDVLRGQLDPQKAADRLNKEWTSGRYTTK